MRHTPATTPMQALPDSTFEDVPEENEDPFIGQTPLGQYEILKKIGEGGFGAVYIADQLGVGRKAVIKVLRQGLAGSGQFVQRFRREATVLAALDHHHLVRLYNFGELDDGQLFLAMEYGGDRTLADEIKLAGRLTESRALRITSQVCAALHEAHTRGIVHRDLKPQNIMLSQKDGQDWVKVVDVGIAKILDGTDVDDGQSKLTGTGTIIGTPAYFSPEQSRGQPLDGRSDVYAMGCVLYEMLSGRLPLEASGPIDFVRAHAVDPPIPLRNRGVQVSPALEITLFKRLLCKDRSTRMTALELSEWASSQSRSIEFQLPPPRSRTPMMIGVSAAVAVCVLGGVIAWPRNSPEAVAAAPTPKPAIAAVAQPAAPAPELQRPSPPPPSPAAIPAAAAPTEAKADNFWAGKLQKLNSALRTKKFKDALRQGASLLEQHPPDDAAAQIYKVLATAHYYSGDTQQALHYQDLYRAQCPPAEQPAADAFAKTLRDELGITSGE